MGLRRPVAERFFAKCGEPDENGCIPWLGAINSAHYGNIRIDGRSIQAHRWAYEFAIGPIPVGLVIDHLCRVRHCVNPEHLEAVTPEENTRRGVHLLRSHCPSGHEFTPENTRMYRNARICRACCRVAAATHEKKLRAKGYMRIGTRMVQP